LPISNQNERAFLIFRIYIDAYILLKKLKLKRVFKRYTEAKTMPKENRESYADNFERVK